MSDSAPTPPPSSTGARVATGATWIYAYRWIDRGLNFLSLLVVARCLSKEDFGLVAIAASYIFIIEGLSEFDVKNALIRSRADDRQLFDTAWTLAAIRGLLASLVLLAVSPIDPRITATVCVLAIVPLLDGTANPRFVVFERELNYKRLAAMTLIGTVASVSVTVGLALAYRTHWALVLGIIAGSVARMVSTYALRPYRPSVTLRRWREIFGFSGWMSLATVVSTLSMRTDRIVIGGLIGPGAAGSYDMTQRIGVLPTAELISPLQRVLFPSFSQMADDHPRLRRAALESVNVLASLSLPSACGFALIANDFVPIALDQEYLSIAPLLAVLVPFLGLRATLSNARPCVMALGRTGLMFRVSLIYALVHFPAFFVATALYGLSGAIWAIVLAGFLYFYLNAWLLRETLGITLGEILTQLQRPVLAVAVMVGAVLTLHAAVPLDLFSAEGSWLALSIKMAVGGLAFTAALLGLWRLTGRPEGFERRVLGALRR
ncbi:MAG: lipopolysaccharide biosynthesis protein [Planctomycetota bacterium]